MLNDLMSADNISFIFVFLEGLLSFFSPCVIPLLPVYLGYLAGNTAVEDETKRINYNTKKVFFHTVCFVLGISFAFFILGMSFTALGSFFYKFRALFVRISGIIIIILGLFQLGVFQFKFLQRERKFSIQKILNHEVNPIIAFVVGFTFSFAWTPCVGPALSSVLIMASGAKSTVSGNLLVLVYTLGFVLPFLLLGLFTTKVLNFIKKNQKLMKYTVKASGILLIVIGVITFTGFMNGISSYLNRFTQSSTESNVKPEEEVNESENPQEENAEEESGGEEESSTIPSFDFTLTDQYGVTHTLSDYQGKVVFLNFWATWCPPCKEEMPDIEKLYKEFESNEGDVIFLGVANPVNNKFPMNQDVEEDEIKNFLTDNKYTFPTVFDTTGKVLENYMIQAFPTTFMIDKEGNIKGYYPGMMTEDIMRQIINDTINS